VSIRDWEDEYEPEPVPFPPEDNSKGQAKFLKYLQDELMPAFEYERGRLAKFEKWATGRQPEARNLQQKNNEKRLLQRLARNPWIPLMVATFSQQLIVDGYRKDGSTENQEAWDTWEFNNMHAQQMALNRATMTYGYSYLRVTEGEQVVQGRKMAVLRGVDPQNAFAIYEDAYGDEFPAYLLERRPNGTYRWWTDEDYTILTYSNSKFKIQRTVPHSYGCVPFVRYINRIDLLGRCWGDVEPLMELATRLDKTVFDRLLVQHFNSFKVRWATGLEQPDSEEEVAAAKMKLSNDTVLVSSRDKNEVGFGTLDETDMQPFIQAYKSDLETFLSNAQLPPDLAGLAANLAADALEGARRSTYQKLNEKQVMLGQSHAQALRLAAHVEGRKDDAEDFTTRVHWQDVSVLSLAQFADAWGKMCDQLGVPKMAAWKRIPGIEQSETVAWEDMLLDDRPEVQFLRELGFKKNETPGGPNSTRNQRRPGAEE
jgi:hypothetical protein